MMDRLCGGHCIALLLGVAGESSLPVSDMESSISDE